MKLIGILGGLSWESSADYYRLLNESVKKRLGGLHSARCVMYSFDFAPIVESEEADDLRDVARQLLVGIRALEKAGAELLVIACNSVHMVADIFEPEMKIPLLHIVDPTGEAIRARGLRAVGLLGTGYTMGKPFYRERLAKKFGVTALVPDAEERRDVHRIIFEELCLGTVREESRERFREVMEGLKERGAEGIVLGCTELPMLISGTDTELPLFNSTQLHVDKALELAMGEAADNKR
ncbi:MAG: aspartate/glutamate racemase family protein [Planctomycetota bacterium]